MDVAVIGKPDKEAGEIPKAYIVLKPEYRGQNYRRGDNRVGEGEDIGLQESERSGVRRRTAENASRKTSQKVVKRERAGEV